MDEGLVGWTVESSGHGCPVLIQVRRAGVEDFQRLRLDVRVTYRGKTRVLDTDLTGSFGRDGIEREAPGATRCKQRQILQKEVWLRPCQLTLERR